MSKLRCDNCKRIMTSAPEHEFCSYSMNRPKFKQKELFDGQPPHRPQKELAPIQKPITHDIAPRTARAAMSSAYYDRDSEADGYIALAQNLMEDI